VGGGGPICIGGVGGSGTRVVAELVAALGPDLGGDLNGPLDNLAFTLLFKRPHRFTYSGGLVAEADPVAARAISTFVAAMTHGGSSPARMAHVARAVADVGLHPARGDVFEPHDRQSTPARTRTAIGRARRLVAAMGADRPAPERWAWKEPNSFVFLPALYRCIPDLRYVHVVRNGLDMALSANDAQVRNWSRLYDLPAQPGAEVPAADRLRYWARANTAVADYLTGRPGAVILRYEDVTGDPRPTLRRLCDAMALEETDRAGAIAAGLHPSASTGRHERAGGADLLDAAGAEARHALERFGYLPG
jgi:hypothetical protein